VKSLQSAHSIQRQRETRKDKSSATNPFYINKIFETNSGGHYTDRALLYQNILEFSKITEKKLDDRVVEKSAADGKKIKFREQHVELQIDPDSFRLRELENWLMENNKQFINYYTDSKSHTPPNVRAANNDQVIRKCVNHLESSQLLQNIEMVKSAKNLLPTPKYKITHHGVIILYLIKYGSADQKDKLKIRHIIIEIIKRHLSNYNSYFCDFLSLVYAKSMQKGFGNSIIDLFFRVVHTDNHNARTLVDVLNIILYAHLLDKQTRDHFVNIWIEVINGLEENIKKVIMYHCKADIEGKIHLFQPPKDWEEMWIKNIQDYSKFVLYGICSSCSQKYPVLVDFYVFQKFCAFQKNPNLKMDCNKCNSKATLQVYSTIQ
jgi:hypothetical protein